jgi:hypothetical protein
MAEGCCEPPLAGVGAWLLGKVDDGIVPGGCCVTADCPHAAPRRHRANNTAISKQFFRTAFIGRILLYFTT